MRRPRDSGMGARNKVRLLEGTWHLGLDGPDGNGIDLRWWAGTSDSETAAVCIALSVFLWFWDTRMQPHTHLLANRLSTCLSLIHI